MVSAIPPANWGGLHLFAPGQRPAEWGQLEPLPELCEPNAPGSQCGRVTEPPLCALKRGEEITAHLARASLIRAWGCGSV